MPCVARECSARLLDIGCSAYANLFDDVREEDLLGNASALYGEFACCGCICFCGATLQPCSIPEAQLSKPLLTTAADAVVQQCVQCLHVAVPPSALFFDGEDRSCSKRGFAWTAHAPHADKVVDLLCLCKDAACPLCDGNAAADTGVERSDDLRNHGCRIPKYGTMRQERCFHAKTDAFVCRRGQRGELLRRQECDLTQSVLCVFGASYTAGEAVCAKAAAQAAKLLYAAADQSLEQLTLRNCFVVVDPTGLALPCQPLLSRPIAKVAAAHVEADPLAYGNGIELSAADGGKAFHVLEPHFEHGILLQEVAHDAAVLRALQGKRQPKCACAARRLDWIGVNKAQPAEKKPHEVGILVCCATKFLCLNEPCGKDAAQDRTAEEVLGCGHNRVVSKGREDHGCFGSDLNFHCLHQRLPPFRVFNPSAFSTSGTTMSLPC